MSNSSMSRRWGALSLLLAAAIALAVSIGMTARVRAERRPRSAPFPVALMASDARACGWQPAATGTPQLVVVASESCAHCHEQVRQLGHLGRQRPALFQRVRLTIVAVRGPAGRGARPLPLSGAPEHELVVDQGCVTRALRVRAVPTSYLIDGNGTVVDVLTGTREPGWLAQRLELLARR